MSADRTAGPRTVVSFHAHPDDESLLTGGTLARLSAEGHRVVLVTATLGEAGLAGEQDGRGGVLGRTRAVELQQAARALGVHRVETLAYADSGLAPGTARPAHAFADADVEEAATRLAALLVEEGADVLTVYDRHGGYGHPDHVQVHRVGTRAAQLAGTPVVLEATVPDRAFRAVLAVLRLARQRLGSSAPLGTDAVFTPSRQVTHRVRVGHHLDAKRAGMRAHASQQRGGWRSLDVLVRLPRPVFALALGHEWFVEQGRTPRRRREGDVLASLRG
ncbi:N-acetylglucosaminyl deacetylase, LmbE family [Nocardioides scoriae]|uniref:N-acetylglucosaminyl deacetylase, LmbE family n=1 Tax=Nocardioides scoriae TaxID=642780 RepID=A0A1H1WC51_9ACTN|nr:PIG-L family deacetylase [Nocardioides scoriae]SDS93729.1 N-acetylglucosaminyl deacetylase, LmbE family [Nocardioides scoriae]